MPGRISETDIDRVRSANDLVDVAGERIALTRRGNRHWAQCPFHDDSKPSFSINNDLYYCQSCQAGGDVFKFIMELDSISFVEAVEKLAARSGIELRYEGESAAERRRRELRPRLQDAVAAAVEFYTDRLRRDPAAATARSYLVERGYGKDVANRFCLGWAPDAWDALALALKKRGYRQDELREAGLARPGRSGSIVDFLHSRLIFSIFDERGAPVALAGRVLPGADPERANPDGPKYINTPETSLYHKSRVLYGLNWARESIVASQGTAIVVEGYTDVIGLHLAGVTNAVATCGTAFGDDHLRLLRRWADTIVLAFDGDEAGERAVERVFSPAVELGIDARVVILPEGRDPADVAADGADALAAVLARQQPLFEYRVDRAVAPIRIDSVEGEQRALRAGADVIARHPNAPARAAMARRLARRLRDVTEDEAVRVVERVRATTVAGGARTRVQQTGEPGTGISRVERYALAAYLQYPALFLEVEAVHGIEFAPDWFEHPTARRIVLASLGIARQSTSGPIDIALLDLEDTVLARVRELLVWEPPGFADDIGFVPDAREALYRNLVNRAVRSLPARIDEAAATGDGAAVQALDRQLVAFIGRKHDLGEL